MTQFVVDIEEAKSFLDVMPYPELAETRIYKEWAQPQGIVDALMCLLDKSATSVGYFVLFRTSETMMVTKTSDASRHPAHTASDAYREGD